jgi:biopolymer transport protein ExbD
MSNTTEKFEPNLTPILDMVFQLITFFMLVINFKTASMDTTLNLPVIGSAQPADASGQGKVIVLNVDANGKLRVYGQLKDAEQYISDEARVLYYLTKTDEPDMKFGDELPATIVLRADKNIPFHLLNQVVRTCQLNGFRKFHYRAMNKAPEA